MLVWTPTSHSGERISATESEILEINLFTFV